MDNAVNVSGGANVSVVLGFAELCNQPFVDGNKLPWELDEERQPYKKGNMDADKKSTLFGAGVVGSLLLLLLAL